ncbi:acyltransferase family protein [Mycolicibacterium sp.]|uniref:acyltransferase family protein n=1 Tax=Mycolicibacterium sp. TaxID=2320850 RepID=UPI003415CAF4
MRAIAVLSVVADHLVSWPSGGFVGVDVFFVLSGFFISGLLIRERTTTGRLSFRDFYIRRVKRILPSALLVLVVTVIGSYVLFPAIRAKETLVDGLYAAVFAANIRFQAVGADYFQQGQPPSPLQHYWSLSIEEQFYFIWPVVIVVIFALTRRFRGSGRSSTRLLALFGAMAIVVAASFGWAMLMSANDPNGAYFSTFTRVWELGVGALVAIGGPWLARIPTAIRPVLAYLGLAGVIGSLFLIDSTVQFPAPWAGMPVLSTGLIVASFQGADVRGMFPLTNPVARYFGDTSYTLYLWHWPVIMLLLTIFPKGRLLYGIALAVALGLTVITYHFYEDPIRKSNWLLDTSARRGRKKPKLTTSGWGFVGALIVVAVVMSISYIQYDDKLSEAAKESQGAEAYQQLVTKTTVPSPAAKIDPCFGAPAMITAGCVMRNPDVPLRPSVDTFAQDKSGTENCWRTKDEVRIRSCNFGYGGPDTTRIALIGDSHAEALIPALQQVLIANKWQLTTYVGDGCQWRFAPPHDCPMDEIQTALLSNPPALVLTTSVRLYGGEPADFQKVWAPVLAAGSRIAVIADNPQVSEDSIACLTRVSLGGDRTGECGTSRAEGFAHPDPLVSATSLVPEAAVIDLTPYYCTADRCPSVIGNVIVYRDTNAHLTATFVKTLAPAIADEIRRALGTPMTGSR